MLFLCSLPSEWGGSRGRGPNAGLVGRVAARSYALMSADRGIYLCCDPVLYHHLEPRARGGKKCIKYSESRDGVLNGEKRRGGTEGGRVVPSLFLSSPLHADHVHPRFAIMIRSITAGGRHGRAYVGHVCSLPSVNGQ